MVTQLNSHSEEITLTVLPSETVGRRRLSGAMGSFVRVFAIVFCVSDMLYIWAVFARMGIIAFNALTILFLAAAGLIVLTFLLFPAGKGASTKVPWYDFILIIAGVTPCIYAFMFSDAIIDRYTLVKVTMVDEVMFIMLLLVTLEASRRVLGLAMPIVVSILILYSAFCGYLPGILFSKSFDLRMLTLSLFMGTSGVWGVALSAVVTMVFPFMVFARLIQISGAGTFFLKAALAICGHTQGGPAKAAVISSGLFGSISGSSAANVVTTGSITIPMMKGSGWRAETAAGVEAVASNGGVIMPPLMGAVAFIMSEYVGIPYGKLIFVAFIPAVLYYISAFIVVHQEAKKQGLKGLPREQIPSLKRALLAGWPYILPLIAIILFLGIWNIQVGRGALLGSLVLLGAVALKSTGLIPREPGERKVSASMVVDAVEGGAKMTILPGIACMAAGFIIGGFMITGLGLRLSSEILFIAHGNVIVILLLAALLSFILGMGLTAIPCYLVIAVLVAPSLVNAGIPLVAAHLFCLYWGVVSYITPPVCLTSYITAGISGADPMRTGVEGSRIGIASYLVPFIFVFYPGLVLQGSLLDIVIGLAIGLLAIYCFASFAGGWVHRKLSYLERFLLLGGGFCLIMPYQLVMLAGLAIVAGVLLAAFRPWQKARTRNTKS